MTSTAVIAGHEVTIDDETFLIIKEASLLGTIETLFGGRGPAVLESNLKAFALGKKAALGS